MTHLHGLRQLPARAVRALIVLGLLLALAMIVAGLHGCSSKPVLPEFPIAEGMAVRSPTFGLLYVFDQENMDKLAARLSGLADGTCVVGAAPKQVGAGERQ